MRLKELRKKQNLNQSDIAKYLNIQQSTYSGYESETYEPTIGTLKKLAEFYHTTIDYLVGRDTQILDLNGVEPIKKRLILDILNMNDFQKFRAQSYFDGLFQR